MFPAINMQATPPRNSTLFYNLMVVSWRRTASPGRRSVNTVVPFTSLSLQNRSSPSTFTSSLGTAEMETQWSLVQFNLKKSHILTLNALACGVAFSACWLFLSAIPTLLGLLLKRMIDRGKGQNGLYYLDNRKAFKKASESLEKLLDVTREELPDTMAAVRLSGMEINDLTMELSDLSQEITQGVRSSTRAVRLAEDKLRRLTNMASTGTDNTEIGGHETIGGKNCEECS